MENSEEKNLDVKDTMQDKAYKVIKKCKEIAEKDFTKFSALFVAVMTVGLWVIKGMWYAYQSGRFSVYGIASCYITSDDESFLLQIIQLAAVLIVWFGINYLFYTILVSEDETKYHWKRKLKSVVFWIVEMLLLLIMVLITSRVSIINLIKDSTVESVVMLLIVLAFVCAAVNIYGIEFAIAIRGKLVPQDSNDEPASVLLERIRAEKEELIKQGKIKRDKKESIIFKGEDNSYYENISNNTICIDEEVPFDLPDGWIWCRLKSLADPHENSFVDGPFGSNLKTDHYTDRREVRIIQLNNIGEFTWKNNGIKYTTYSHAETLSRCKSYPGDIVIAKMMPAGRAIIIPDIEDVYVISSDCVRLQLPNYIDKRYVMYMINSPTINKSVMKNVQGIGRTRTSLSKLKELLVPIPPYKQQCQISATFDKSLFYFDTINALCE